MDDEDIGKLKKQLDRLGIEFNILAFLAGFVFGVLVFLILGDC